MHSIASASSSHVSQALAIPAQQPGQLIQQNPFGWISLFSNVFRDFTDTFVGVYAPGIRFTL